MDREAKFWDKVADRYSRRPISDEATYTRKLEVTRDYLQSHMDVLEIGCGTGTTAIAHAPYVKHILATDLSPRMIEIATEKAKAAGIDTVAFDWSGFRYHGRVKALADAAREAGLKF